jgi:hypothetical protein
MSRAGLDVPILYVIHNKEPKLSENYRTSLKQRIYPLKAIIMIKLIDHGIAWYTMELPVIYTQTKMSDWTSA